jgi:hypothetical protein
MSLAELCLNTSALHSYKSVPSPESNPRPCCIAMRDEMTYSTVTDLAKLRGLSMSHSFLRAT